MADEHNEEGEQSSGADSDDQEQPEDQAFHCVTCAGQQPSVRRRASFCRAGTAERIWCSDHRSHDSEFNMGERNLKQATAEELQRFSCVPCTC